ncbi:MAG: diguanylate cyclase domain-containing protein, partial [Stenotrophomonas maltophilia]
GDEFLLAVHADGNEAGERVTRWLAQLAAPARAGDPPVRASAGAAGYRPGDDLREAYRRADAAMYRAKYAGGGRLLRAED